MITSYEPLILLAFLCITIIANRTVSSQSKLDIIFSIHSVFFMWFLYHFLYSVF